MILKSINLKNIRSYKDETVDFPQGIILFEGDIGSGKSTILYGIEFALFGLGDLGGNDLLKLGTNEGFVSLEFEVNGKNYKIFRSLKRKGKTIGQDAGYIVIEGVRTDLSVTELKVRILEILGFNEKLGTKTTSVIYRYAVFTPQEMMKDILYQKVEDRLETLRKAFGIEEYIIAADNSKLVSRQIHDKVKVLEGEIKDLDVLRGEFKEKEGKLKGSAGKLKEAEKLKNKNKEELDKIKLELKEKTQLREKLKIIESEIPKIESWIAENSELMKDFNEKIEKMHGENKEKKEKIKELSKLPEPTKFTKEELEEKINEIKKFIADYNKNLGNIDGKIEDFESLIKEKICPTCERGVDPKEFSGKVGEKQRIKEGIQKEMEKLQRKETELKDLMEKLRLYQENQKEINRFEELINKNNGEISGLKEKIQELEKKISTKNIELKEKRKEFDKNKHVFEEIEKLDELVSKKDLEFVEISNDFSSKEKEVKMLGQQVEETKGKITQKENQKKKFETYREYVNWLEEFFIPTVKNIERHVLVNINFQFNNLFKKWFDTLMEDTEKSVHVDENFTPIIEQEGYEINSPSGGEKTSVAFAYRLALNTIVKETCTAMKTNLIILDEPTDGFSKEQLFRVRDVLNDLVCNQIILVSHEKELEGFVDHLFRVEKHNGISVIKKM